jgi:hypothetical protein
MSGSCTKCENKNAEVSKKNQAANCLLSRMQDGRSFTDYRPRCTVQYQMKNEANNKNSYDTRQFLIHNADNMMKVNLDISTTQNACPSSMPNGHGTMLPEKNMVKCDKHTCNFETDVNMYGLGTGRIYN